MESREYDAMHQAEDRHWWYRAVRGVLAVLIGQSSSSEAGVLDVGCGTGGTLRNTRLGTFAVGLDASARALQFCGRDGLSPLVRASAGLLPFRTGSFGRVVSLDVFCHRSIRVRQALREVHRVLRKGGAFFMNLPAYQVLYAHHDVSVHTDHRFTRGEVAKALRRSGLTPDRITYWNFLLFPLEFAYRVLDKCLLPDRKARSEVSYGSPALNAMFMAVLRLELWLLRRVNLPVGLSVFSAARKTQ